MASTMEAIFNAVFTIKTPSRLRRIRQSQHLQPCSSFRSSLRMKEMVSLQITWPVTKIGNLGESGMTNLAESMGGPSFQHRSHSSLWRATYSVLHAAQLRKKRYECPLHFTVVSFSHILHQALHTRGKALKLLGTGMLARISISVAISSNT